MRVRAFMASAVAAGVWLLVAAGSGAAAPSHVPWQKCFVDFGPFQCGTVQVPLDYDHSSGGTISISLIRLPAGGSGVEYTLFAGPFLYTPAVRAHFDLVGFDPRGIGRSTALRCFGNPKQWGPYFLPIAFPTTAAEERAWIRSDLFLDSACGQRGGSIIDHMSTANVARDLDRLRQAVGDAKLNYAGVSYGSYLGVTYANLFPGRVRAVIVDGVIDPIAWATGRGGEGNTVPFSTRLESDVGAQATLEQFFRLCDAGGPKCAFAPHAAARFAALAARLKQSPVVITFPDGSSFVLDYSTLIAGTLGAMYDSSSWEGFAETLAEVEGALEAGSAPASLRADLRQLRFRPAYISKRGFPRYPNLLEGFPAVGCADTDNPHSYAAWSAAGAAADAAHGYFGRIWTWVSSVCAKWPAADSDRYPGPFNHRTANPVLVIGNLFDPATRYQGAVTVAHLLPNSELLTVHGWGHTSLFLSRCADQVQTRYLLHPALPRPGIVCEQDRVPFTGS
ncbi:MAG: alpha/beta hydrolase [Actinobacteria bacterium]|nr:MAG: alpha/beta hydrolase [Actinomycetota bacterium]